MEKSDGLNGFRGENKVLACGKESSSSFRKLQSGANMSESIPNVSDNLCQVDV